MPKQARPFQDNPKEQKRAFKVLSNIGNEKRKPGRPSIPDGLTENLSQEFSLHPATRKAVAMRLIDIALTGKDSDSLKAITEIYDRLEGKSRTRVESSYSVDDPLLRILAEVTEQPKQLESGPFLEVIEGEVHEVETVGSE